MLINPSVMITVPASGISGPAKGIFQQLICYKRMPGNFLLYNFRLPGEKENSDAFLKEARKHDIEVKYFMQNKRFDYESLKYSKKEAITNKINIFQSHGYKPGVIGWFLKNRTNLKWVCFMHGTIVQDFKLRIYNIIDNLIQLYADRVVLVCEAQRKKIIGGRNFKRVKVINNGIDINSPIKISRPGKIVRQSLGFNDSEKLVVCVSRLSYEKGLDIIVRAFPKLIEKDQSIYGVIVGDGPLKNEIKRLIEKVKMKDRLRLVGYSEHPGDYMQVADVVVLPSRSEGMPNVILEAMALGKPVVATDVGGVAEIISHNISGLVIKPENIDELIGSIIKILSEDEFSKKISDAALKEVKDKFSYVKRAKKIYDVYLDLINNTNN